ncbi:hypothetical protein ABA78_07850 [Serratia sp. TEL]|nr:hypothetical protein ABA78_07850 [Serratia sp. TEL]
MDNKLSELSNPVAEIKCHEDLSLSVVNVADGFGLGRHPVYSQEYVFALQHESAVNWEASASLNVENQELKKRIAELERANTSQDDHINQQQDRIESLEKTNAGLGRRLGDAEKRLATPVRLQSPWVDKAGNRWLLEGTTADVIRAAGFAVTVEGDE